MLDKILSALAPAATKRASVFTPMLIFNLIFGSLSFLVYLRSGNLAVFIPELLLACYSVYRHEQWAKKDPGLLAPQKVALRWLDLTMGDNTHIIEGETIVQDSAIPNPELKQIEQRGKDK